jgi:hypothetical protein
MLRRAFLRVTTVQLLHETGPGRCRVFAGRSPSVGRPDTACLHAKGRYSARSRIPGSTCDARSTGLAVAAITATASATAAAPNTRGSRGDSANSSGAINGPVANAITPPTRPDGCEECAVGRHHAEHVARPRPKCNPDSKSGVGGGGSIRLRG